MALGQVIRRMAGPFEGVLTRAYRAVFFNLESFARSVASLGRFRSVIEIGCGEGALLTLLARNMPSANLIGLDPSERAGRLFEGDRKRVTLYSCQAPDYVDPAREGADLVVICDVMHHVPLWGRRAVLRAAGQLASETGTIVVKEWIRTRTPIFWLGWVSDTFVTGDHVQYETRAHWLQSLGESLPSWQVVREMSVSPWRSNHAFVLRRVTSTP